MLRERSEWPVEKAFAESPSLQGDWQTVARYGDAGSYQSNGTKIYFRCSCGHTLAPAEDNWKHYARQHEATASELGPRISLHDDLEALFFACPSCSRLLDVEIKLTGEDPLFDIAIDSEGS